MKKKLIIGTTIIFLLLLISLVGASYVSPTELNIKEKNVKSILYYKDISFNGKTNAQVYTISNSVFPRGGDPTTSFVNLVFKKGNTKIIISSDLNVEYLPCVVSSWSKEKIVFSKPVDFTVYKKNKQVEYERIVLDFVFYPKQNAFRIQGLINNNKFILVLNDIHK